MRIVFDARTLALGPITGVGRAFLTGLSAYREAPAGAFAVLWPERGPAPPPELEGCELVPAPAGALATQARLPGLLRRMAASVLHSPVAAVPLRARCAVVTTVHDLPWMAPGGAPDEGGFLRRCVTRSYVRRADAVLVPSKATADDLIRWSGGSARQKTRIVPHGVAAPPATDSEPDGPFLALGDARPRKNRARLAAAHARARLSCPELPDLVFLGPPDRYVDEPEKWRRLRGSRALLHCSLWEGFGLPVLEAMACGVPVLCSSAASLPEVAGGAALLVDPLDEHAIAAALVRLHRDAALRAELQRKGLRRAAEFPPERTAAAWRELHRECVR